ncbi:MAG: hypothetical protein V3U60_11880, partial [Gammaproteobacteria bacterium]
NKRSRLLVPFVCDGYRRDLKPQGSTDLPGANRNGRRPARRAEYRGEPDKCKDPVSLRSGERAFQGRYALGFQVQQECAAQKVWSNPLGDAILKSADRLVTIPALACVWNLCHYGRFPADLANGWLLTII